MSNTMRFVLVNGALQEVPHNVLAQGPAEFLQRHIDRTLEHYKETFHQWLRDTFVHPIEKGIDGYYDFVSWFYTQATELVTIFPLAVFGNPYVYKMQMAFTGYAVFMIVLLSMLEGLKAILGFSYTSFLTLIGRTVVSSIGMGLTIPAVLFLIKCSNLLVYSILRVSAQYTSNAHLGEAFRTLSYDGLVNFVASLLFLLACLYFILLALLRVGRRWFDLLMNLVISPLAWAAYVTNGTARYLSDWFRSTGRIILANIVYAFYVAVLSLVIMLPIRMDSVADWLVKMLLVLGGLYRLANPPSWIRSLNGGGSIIPVLKDVAQLITLKKFRNIKG